MLFAAVLALLPSLGHSGQLWKDVCTGEKVKNLPFCDMGKSIPERVADYVKRVPLADKAQMMVNGAAPFDDLSIPAYQWGSEGLHGPLQPCVCTPDNKTCRCPTSFPCPSALGTAFNDSLYFMIGQADGREARAINNLRNHVTQNVYGDGIDYWSPTINMQRDPRWGRNQEVPGEDPLLTGNYASMFVQGLQGSEGGLDEKRVQITACCKHFVANSLENWKNYSRHNFDAPVSDSDLYNYYLPAFRSCVMEGRALGIMCSYNAVNGIPSCANDFLLQKTLRESWRFDGYVTSDCGAIRDECTDEPSGHGYTNCTQATADSILAGTDVDCGGVYNAEIENAVKSGALKEGQVDVSFARLTTIQMRLGLFDNDKATQPYFNLGIDDIDTAQHQQLALEAAQQSIVLLKNDDGVLPIKAGSKVAVVGPHYNATELLLSNYHGAQCAGAPGQGPGTGHDFTCMTSILQAITAANGGGSTVGSSGCDVNTNRTDHIGPAVKAAKDADIVILTVGIDQDIEREGRDRDDTTLPGVQPQLVDAILALNKKTVMVLFNGGAMSLGEYKNKVPAIVDAFYGGGKGAEALADVLFGKYNPSGKLAATMYPPEYVNQIPLTEMGLTVSPGRTHMFYKGTPEFEFGFGLSYTSWHVEWVDAEEALPIRWSLSANDIKRSRVRARVHNTGTRSGRQTLLLFVRPKTLEAAATRDPHMASLARKLVGYRGTGVHLAPGESHELEFEISPEMLRVAQAADSSSIYKGEYEMFLWDGAENQVTRPLHIVA